MKRLFATMLMILALTVPTVPLWADQAPSDVLAIAPADAWGVACVRHTGEMDRKLNTLIQQLNLPFPFQNPVTTGLTMFGFMSGVDATGGVGVVVLQAPSFQAVQDRTVMLIPITDMDELLSLLEPEEAEAGVSKIMHQNQEKFIARKGNYAILGPSLEVVKEVLASTASVRSRLNAHQAKHYEKDDVVIWINAEAVTAGSAFKAMLPMLQMMNVDADMLTQMRTVALSLRIAPAGIGIGLYADGIPGTDTYRSLCSQKGTTGSLLLGLPKDRYVLGYGAVSSKEASEIGAKMLAKALDNPQIQALGLDPAKLEQVKNMIVSRVKLLRTLSVGISGLPEGPDGLVSLTKVVEMDGDPREGLALFAELVAIIKGGLVPREDAAEVLGALEYKPGAETIGGIPVDHLFFDLAKAAGFEEEAQEAQKAEWLGTVSKILGKDGILFRLGVVGDRYVVASFGGGAERFQTVAALVKEKKTPLADDGGIQRSRSHLPAARNAEGYLAVDHLLNLVGAIARAADAPIPPLSLGDLNAPIAFAGQPVEKGGSQVEVFLPMELVIAVKDLVMGMVGGPGVPVTPPPPTGPGEPGKEPAGVQDS